MYGGKCIVYCSVRFIVVCGVQKCVVCGNVRCSPSFLQQGRADRATQDRRAPSKVAIQLELYEIWLHSDFCWRYKPEACQFGNHFVCKCLPAPPCFVAPFRSQLQTSIVAIMTCVPLVWLAWLTPRLCVHHLEKKYVEKSPLSWLW